MWINDSPNNKIVLRFREIVCASLIGVGAGFQWFFCASYSRGYDYFLWLYNAHFFIENITQGRWPNWIGASASGHPFLKMGGLADAFLFSLFIGPLGIDYGPRLYVIVVYCVAATGMYVLMRNWKVNHNSAVMAAVVYVFSWFFTHTVDYTTYLSNFLLYALMPWSATCMVFAVRKFSFGWLLLCSASLFVAVTINAQVSVKLAIFVLSVGAIERHMTSCSWRVYIRYCFTYLLMAGSVALFLILPAIDLKSEVVQLASYRKNLWISPWMMLSSIPMLGYYLLSQKMGWSFTIDDRSLALAVHSDYVGISVLFLAVIGLSAYKKNGRVIGLFWVLIASLLVYWCVIPFLPNGAWTGNTHNWAILHTLWLSLLAGYGTQKLLSLESVKVRKNSFYFFIFCAVVAELGGLRYALNSFALTHESPEQLPEVQVWKRLAANMQSHERWYTYNPDHTHYLFPILTAGKPTANIVELRSRTDAYDSFLKHQVKSVKNLDSTYNASESLSLLNVRYVDLPIQTFAYRGDIASYPLAIELLEKDVGLRHAISRDWMNLDFAYDAKRSKSELSLMVNGENRKSIAQTIFKNDRPLWAFLPNFTIAIVGNKLHGERLFEQITHLPNFRADRILYLLLDENDYETLDPRVAGTIHGYIFLDKIDKPPTLPILKFSDLSKYYTEGNVQLSNSGIKVERLYQTDQEIGIRIGKRTENKFLFLSLQHFSSWQAVVESEDHHVLPVYTAGAGLTGIWIPPSVSIIDYRYILPGLEKFARIWSVLSSICFIGFWFVMRKRKHAYR